LADNEFIWAWFIVWRSVLYQLILIILGSGRLSTTMPCFLFWQHEHKTCMYMTPGIVSCHIHTCSTPYVVVLVFICSMYKVVACFVDIDGIHY